MDLFIEIVFSVHVLLFSHVGQEALLKNNRRGYASIRLKHAKSGEQGGQPPKHALETGAGCADRIMEGECALEANNVNFEISLSTQRSDTQHCASNPSGNTILKLEHSYYGSKALQRVPAIPL